MLGGARGTVLASCVAVAACEDLPAAPRTPPRWPCPAEWVAHGLGGCGPAVLLCARDGGAAAGACDGLDLALRRPLSAADPEAGEAFRLLPDGGIGGAWPEALPELTVVAGIPTCPEDWSRADDGTCTPAFADTCAAAQEYPDLGPLGPGARVIHVRAGAQQTPDGTAEAPFPTITQALATASVETWVRIAPGTYPENLTLRPRVHLWGCRHRVTVEGAAPGAPTILVPRSTPGAELVGLTLRGDGNGVRAEPGARVTLRVVDIVGARSAAVIALGLDLFLNPARVELTDCVVRDTQAAPGRDGVGFGLDAERGGEVSARRTWVQASRGAAVFSAARGSGRASLIELTDCVVEGTLTTPTGGGGYGLEAVDGALLRATRTLVRRSYSVGAFASDASITRPGETPARVTLTDCVVEDTLPRPRDQVAGFGLLAQDGAVVEAVRTRVSRSHSAGAQAVTRAPDGTGSRVELTGCLIEDTRPTGASGEGGFGLSAQAGGVIVATGTALRRNRGAGAIASNPGDDPAPARVELTDCVVEGTRSRESDGTQGMGLSAQTGGTVLATRTLLVGNQDMGALSIGVDPAREGVVSTLELTECVVRDTLPRTSGGTGGFAVSAQEGGALRVRRSLLLGSRESSALAVGSSGGHPSTLRVSDSAVRDTAARGNFGVALAAIQGAALELRRVVVSRSQGGGVMAAGVSTRTTLEDVLVLDVSAPDERGGFGVVASSDAVVTARRVSVVRSHGAALAAMPSTTLRLTAGGATLDVQDAYVRDVGSGTIDSDPCRIGRVVGPRRAYGVYVGAASAVALERLVLLQGEVGAAAYGGSLRWRLGVVEGFRHYVVRGSSVVTPAPRLAEVVAPGPEDLAISDDPSLPDERLPEPILDPAQGTLTCRGGP
ncbi:MAG: DUF1565 domain-containing protein [Deltaproteobacteria bacterium]|nr:DUF1565 domain-containing protein [Deltaproteobacteria bacterium]